MGGKCDQQSTNSWNECEIEYMEKAFHYAKEALSKGEVPVGCIFVYEDNVVAVGRNEVNETHNATRHAEMICIDEVNKYCIKNELNVVSVFKQISVFVTVEPCIMCAAALYDLDVREICFGCMNDRFGGSTVLNVKSIMDSRTKLKGGYKDEQAMALLKEFYKGSNPNAPIEKVKLKNKT